MRFTSCGPLLKDLAAADLASDARSELTPDVVLIRLPIYLLSLGESFSHWEIIGLSMIKYDGVGWFIASVCNSGGCLPLQLSSQLSEQPNADKEGPHGS